jgi:hypothetical protein
MVSSGSRAGEIIVATSSTFIDGAVADVDKINFYVFGEPKADRQRWFLNGLLQEMKRHGHTEESDVTDQLRLVLNVVDIENPTYFRRKAQGTFVAAIVETDHEPEDVIRAAYPMLLKALSNVAMYLVPRGNTLMPTS